MAAVPLPLAVQLYSVRDITDLSFHNIVTRLAAQGYQGVELVGQLAVPHTEAAPILRDAGLKAVSSHFNPPPGGAIEAALPQIQELADHYGITRFVMPWLDPASFTDADAVKRHCDTLNTMNQRMQSEGYSLGYHNHWEFKPLDGTTVPALMAEHLDPAVFLEVDAYWVTVGGLDPAEVVAALGDRLPLLHVKDGPAEDHDAPMVAIGDGALDYEAIVHNAPDALEWLIVELDHCATDMLTALDRGARYLASRGLAKLTPAAGA